MVSKLYFISIRMKKSSKIVELTFGVISRKNFNLTQISIEIKKLKKFIKGITNYIIYLSLLMI